MLDYNVFYLNYIMIVTLHCYYKVDRYAGSVPLGTLLEYAVTSQVAVLNALKEGKLCTTTASSHLSVCKILNVSP